MSDASYAVLSGKGGNIFSRKKRDITENTPKSRGGIINEHNAQKAIKGGRGTAQRGPLQKRGDAVGNAATRGDEGVAEREKTRPKKHNQGALTEREKKQDTVCSIGGGCKQGGPRRSIVRKKVIHRKEEKESQMPKS